MYNLKLYPYKMGSESAVALADLLDILKVKPDGNYVPKFGQKVINWGNGRTPDWATIASNRGVTMLNKPAAVNVASNKLTALQALRTAGIAIPEFTTDMNVASQWLRLGHTVVERHELRGNSGDGIRIVTLHDDEMERNLTRAPLYTRFITKTAEFRVHVFQGQVIDYIEKKKVTSERRDHTFNRYISSINCGWVFSRTNVRDIPEVRQLGIRAVQALGLDFGAVDIVFADGIAYVLEVNTAPGLSGTTLVNYANAFLRYMGQSDLSNDRVRSIVGDHIIAPAAQPRAQAAEVRVNNDDVILRLDRATALKIRSLLANI